MELEVSFHPTTTTLRLPAACGLVNGTSRVLLLVMTASLLLTWTKLTCPAARAGNRSHGSNIANPNRNLERFRSFSHEQFIFTVLASRVTDVLLSINSYGL